MSNKGTRCTNEYVSGDKRPRLKQQKREQIPIKIGSNTKQEPKQSQITLVANIANKTPAAIDAENIPKSLLPSTKNTPMFKRFLQCFP